MRWPWKRPHTNGRAKQAEADSAQAVEDAEARQRRASGIGERIRTLREHDAFGDAVDQALRGH